MSDFTTDRLKRAVAAFVRELFPRLDFLGVYEYIVVLFDESSQTAELTPASGTNGLPNMVRVATRLPGIKIDLKIGTSVLVGFENGDSSRPYLAFYDRFAGSGFLPDNTNIDANLTLTLGAGATAVNIGEATAFSARVGDTITIPIGGISVVGGGLTSPATNPAPVTGTITSGSPKVKT